MKKFLFFTSCILILASACGGGDSASSEDQKIIDALADAVMADEEFPGTDDDAKCIAETHVSILGAAYIQENNLTDGATFDDWDPAEAELSRNDFKNLFKETIGCVEKGFQAVLGEDADLEGLSEESAECLAKEIVNDDVLDAIYDAGSIDEEPPEEFVFRLLENCPSFLVDSLVEGAGLDQESAECFADKVSYESFIFAIEASSLPEDEMPEGATEVLAEFFAAAVECDIDLANFS
tara:strand:+ start:404 stop:1114 length:711 start_codon:yes stop_codon:yes gene_type:complete